MLTEDVIEKFKHLPAEVIIEVTSDDFTAKLDVLEVRYGINLKLVLMELLVSAVRDDLLQVYFEDNFNLTNEKAISLENEFNQLIIKPLLVRLSLLSRQIDVNILNFEDTKKLIAEIFGGSILSWLSKHPIILQSLNAKIFFIALKDDNFQDDLAKKVFENQSELIGTKVVIDGKSAQPTVGNWLKVFMQEQGSDMATALMLSNFIANSPSVKDLAVIERELLLKVLKTYRNIKFFPESMPNDTGEDWEILPYDHEVIHQFERAGAIEDDRKNDEESRSDSRTQRNDNAGVVNKISMQDIRPSQNQNTAPKQSIYASVAAPSARDKEIAELMAVANKYPVGSLERKAVESAVAKAVADKK